jgi:isoleucyl-tRNA synthetase
LSDTILDRLIEAYRKLRNTFKGVLGNLYDFDPAKDAVDSAEMLEIDQWILLRTEDLIRRCRAWYNSLEFHKVYRAIYDFATTDLSALYIDVLKDRLYTAAPRSKARRSGQTALYRVHYALTRLSAPILAFTMEEVWGYTAKPAGAPGSVHMALLPEPEELTSGFSNAQRANLVHWDKLMALREPVLKALEEARQAKLIGKSLEAAVRITVPADDFGVLQAHAAALPELFIVSQVELQRGETVQVAVELALGEKCERCWKYSKAVGEDERFPTVCDTCSAALKEMGL